ncbi:Protein farnesyltransferase/geranylgeranyltransferase type-1 subunit alpha-like protein [Hapsidospora chrysogenum ATCC 11550]|uniref:Protein farnesyltransferase/geranylgeranyltransferase type-1 subunit alpha-like protein n=1 Tax=Hapsidospora chrysogenum (strain ATCC 11550 / CBS 779.69 / DSM 880 / IAM 14645 / JCM 23072 / IMI 49137) TaxID=857340 RepID=A0A086TG39_HAPC1|nr:Protein farnesyltransferase/geranylgeranyltransferase type-1 subunit alpha-like protein [Hapsidospora chrysogenum ATCC 11550]
MSRALDDRVREALKCGNHDEVYDRISAALAQRCDKLLEIEFLGQSYGLITHNSFMQEDNAIGLPKLRLIQAFIVARRKLNAHLSGEQTMSDQEVLEATAVILVMDAEHLTAANTRKRVLAKATAELLLQEKYFIDSILTSPLHRHTKSPNLWSHRRWLVDRFKALGLPTDVADDMRRVVFVSGERHPRNYYAWCHARYLVTTVGMDRDAMATTLEDCKKWCFRHHDDVSGWMFLMFLLDRTPTYAGDIIMQTLKLAESLQWCNESVWYFVRNLAMSKSKGGKLPEDFSRVLESLRKCADEEERRTLDKTAAWIETRSS